MSRRDVEIALDTLKLKRLEQNVPSESRTYAAETERVSRELAYQLAESRIHGVIGYGPLGEKLALLTSTFLRSITGETIQSIPIIQTDVSVFEIPDTDTKRIQKHRLLLIEPVVSVHTYEVVRLVRELEGCIVCVATLHNPAPNHSM